MKQLRSLSALLIIFITGLPFSAWAASLAVTWNPNTEDDLAGYRVYSGVTSGAYGAPVDVGNVTSYQIADVASGQTYYIAVTAYDTSNNESGFSEEVSVTVPIPDTTPPSGSVVINAGQDTCSSRTVTLSLSAADNGGSVVGMKISNDAQTWTAEASYATSQAWVLGEGDGLKRVSVMFKDAAGNWSGAFSDQIELVQDSDGDALPDAWEIANGLDPDNPNDAVADNDGDGLTNIEEYFNHTNPSDASDNAPVANAGADQTVAPTRVTLDGSASLDPNGDELIYTWSQEGGPVEVAIQDASSAQASFVAVKAGTYEFALECYDGKAFRRDTVTIRVENISPAVSAGSDMVIDAGEYITLHASGTDPNEDSLSFQWSQEDGPGLSLPDMNTADIELYLDEPGQYRFSVTCSDGFLVSEPDEVLVTVNAVNHAPTAEAGGGQDVELGERVVLDGSASSDPDGDELSYTWIMVSGPAVVLNADTTAAPWFDATTLGTYVFALTVTDGQVSSATDTVSIRVLSANLAPIADAGEDLEVMVGDQVRLDAGASYDPDGDGLSFGWTQLSGATVALTGADTPSPTFTPTTSGVLTFQVAVSDAQASSEDVLSVTVNSLNQVPEAHAGEDLVATIGEEVYLDGTQSQDPDGDAISYIWSQTEGARVSLSAPNDATPSFVPEATDTYVFELRVYDGQDTSSPATVSVTVQDGLATIQLLSPSVSSTVRSNPVFSWQGDSIERFTLYLALNGGSYYQMYSGTGTSYALHPILWYWFIPSGTQISWYVTGDDDGERITSEVFTLRKR